MAVPVDLFAQQPTLEGTRIRLVPLGPTTDLDAYEALVADPESNALTGTTRSFSREELAAWLSSRPSQPDRADWGVVGLDGGPLLGEVVLNDLDAENESIGFRIALGADARGRGLGQEVTRLVMAYAFSVGLHRISLEVYAHNPRARRTYEQAGFVVEGRMRDALLLGDRRIDAIVMAALANEWSSGA